MATGIQGTGAGAGGVAARRSRLREIGGRAAEARPATLFFAAAAAVSAGLLLALGSRLTFLLDDWEFLVYRDFSVDAVLEPHNEHISILPVLIYKTLQETVGMDSALPFRIVSTAAFITSVALLFVYLRRRIGEWPALAGAAVILFLGAAWEDLLWPFQIGYFGSMACGLGMLLALERGDRVGDRIACALLTISILFSSLGLPFVAGAAAAIAVGPRGTRLRRAYVVAIPVAVFAAWWLGWGREAETSISALNVATAPLAMLDGLASSISSLLGLATPRDESTIGALSWGRPLLVAALALAGWWLWRLRRVSPWLIVAVAVTATFWLLAGINETPGRDPLASRYQYVGAIFVLLVAAELARPVVFGRVAIAVVFAVAALSVASNLSFLGNAFRSYERTSQLERGGLAAVEITRDRVDPGFVLTEEIAGTAYVHIAAGVYLAAADAYGSPAYTPDELAAAPEEVRAQADVVLVNALGVSLTAADPRQGGRCVEAATSAGEPQAIEALGERTLIKASPEAPVTMRLRRFATEAFVIRAGEVPARGAAVLEIPSDRSERPWQIELDSAEPASVCEAGR